MVDVAVVEAAVTEEVDAVAVVTAKEGEALDHQVSEEGTAAVVDTAEAAVMAVVAHPMVEDFPVVEEVEVSF